MADGGRSEGARRFPDPEGVSPVWVWIVVFVVAVVLIGGFWIGNSVRLAKKNKNWERRSPTAFGSGGPDVDESNRSQRRRP